MPDFAITPIQARLTLDISGLRSAVTEARALIATATDAANGMFARLQLIFTTGMNRLVAAINAGFTSMRQLFTTQLPLLAAEFRTGMESVFQGLDFKQALDLTDTGASMIASLVSGMESALPQALEAVSAIGSQLSDALGKLSIDVNVNGGSGGSSASAGNSSSSGGGDKLGGGLSPGKLLNDIADTVGTLMAKG